MVRYFADENMNLVPEPADENDLSAWGNAFQTRYFPGFDVPGMKVCVNSSPDFRVPAKYYPEVKQIEIAKAITPFHELAKIALLHEMVHVKLHLKHNGADWGHEAEFKEELRRLMREGAYDDLL